MPQKRLGLCIFLCILHKKREHDKKRVKARGLILKKKKKGKTRTSQVYVANARDDFDYIFIAIVTYTRLHTAVTVPMAYFASYFRIYLLFLFFFSVASKVYFLYREVDLFIPTYVDILISLVDVL